MMGVEADAPPSWSPQLPGGLAHDIPDTFARS
jgi:hypothetical protein